MTNKTMNPDTQPDANLDPISGEVGSHPVGTGVGAASVGTVATVVGGVVGGPIGAVVGAAIGSVAGGLTGKSVAEKANPTFEATNWQEAYTSSSYVDKDKTYEDYEPAYRIGYEGYDRYGQNDRSYSEVETDLQRDYETNHAARLPWEKAQHAVKDAWNRASKASQR
ncbi:Glycine zipper domain-containing protein [Tumidithrix helvetica PCC 7403]|uniref:hypothetical protein n=1 Tax=Tumidithrix helvetica TaxID=3457545 RepID=UPI003C86DC4C